jgi:ABC-2 type transport system ATP-binding protein
LTLASGSRVALIGPNGSGKSTLIRALLGMVRTEGEVLIDNHDAYRDRNLLAPRIAYVPQTSPQFSSTVGELVAAVRMIRDLGHGEIERCAERLSLDLEAVAANPMKDLSGGMKQKLTLALALAPRASLLILDEPTASLDAESQRRFYEMLRERTQGATLILSSHRLDEVQRLVSEVVVLDNGRLRSCRGVSEFLGEREREPREHERILPGTCLNVPEPGFQGLARSSAFEE